MSILTAYIVAYIGIPWLWRIFRVILPYYLEHGSDIQFMVASLHPQTTTLLPLSQLQSSLSLRMLHPR
jgi:hypothetical protein